MSTGQEITFSQADLEYLRSLVLAENDSDSESRHLPDELPSDSLLAALRGAQVMTRSVEQDSSRPVAVRSIEAANAEGGQPEAPIQPLFRAWTDWFHSAEGRRCSDFDHETVGWADRLRAAFYAGAKVSI